MKKKTSFLIDIMDTQNHTWQGKIYWVQEKKTVMFRSALEMMQLLSSAITPEEELQMLSAAESSANEEQAV